MISFSAIKHTFLFKRQLLVKNLVFTFIFNIVLNAILGIILFGKKSYIPVWGGSVNLLLDSISTTFCLPFFTYLAIAPNIENSDTSTVKKVSFLHKAYLDLIHSFKDKHTLKIHLQRAFILSLVALCLLIPIIGGLFYFLGIQTYNPIAAICFKSIYAGLVALIVVPFIIADILSLKCE